MTIFRDIKISVIILVVNLLMLSCKQGDGAVCNDGSTTTSTGSGTCSWHGGVDHYLDPNEISVTKTAVLIFIILLTTYFIFRNRKKKG